MTRKELYYICQDEAVAYANSEKWSKNTGEEKSFLIQGYLDAMMEMRKSEITEKKKEYPKTYEECCKVLGAVKDRHYFFTKKDKEDYPNEVRILHVLDHLRWLLICRDAYWKIAGEEMGLGKPWKPDWEDSTTHKFIIYTVKDKIYCGAALVKNHLLAFPTEEMRDAFYENFKELIEECKELL